MMWDPNPQQYNITGLNSAAKIGDFLDNYYNSIEYPNIDQILKAAMLMTLGGDSTQPKTFNDGMNYMNRLSQKLLSLCGTPTNTKPLLNNTSNQLTEDETDTQNYFNFDDIEGIDLDDEDAKK